MGRDPNPELTTSNLGVSWAGEQATQESLLNDYRTNLASYSAWLRQQKPATLVVWGRYDASFITPGGEALPRDVPAQPFASIVEQHMNEFAARLLRAYKA